MDAYQYVLCVVCRNRGMTCVTCGNVGYTLAGDEPMPAKKRKTKADNQRALTDSRRLPLSTNQKDMMVPTDRPQNDKNDVVYDNGSVPTRKAGWRWVHPMRGYGILSIEGTHYFARKSGIQGVWNLTKIAPNEVTYHVDILSTSFTDASCTCQSREEGGCKHIKALIALQSAGKL